jgi:hypothetical protein
MYARGEALVQAQNIRATMCILLIASRTIVGSKGRNFERTVKTVLRLAGMINDSLAWL